jgi:hypothetical protein
MKTIQELKDIYQEAGTVTDEQMERVETKFRMLGAQFCPAESDHFSLEIAAFKAVLKAHTNGKFEEEGYW